MNRTLIAGAGTLATLCIASSALGADMAPVYKAPAAVVTEGGTYFWIDGFYERVRLPAYRVGLHNTGVPGVLADGGVVRDFDQRLDGGGVRGALGYLLPGSSVRFELGGSYVAARQSSTQSDRISTFDIGAQYLDGSGLGRVYNCVTIGVTCAVNGTLSTSYSAWQFNGKAANDWKYYLGHGHTARRCVRRQYAQQPDTGAVVYPIQRSGCRTPHRHL